MRLESSLAVSALVLLAACGGGGDRASSGDTPRATDTPAAAPGPSGTASVKGTVRLAGSAPANPPIDMADEPKCKEKYSSAPREPKVVAGSGGALANAFVYVKSGLPAGAKYPPAASPVEIDQEGCLYQPRVLGLMVDQALAIKNSDALLHNIKAMPKTNRPFNISQPTAGMTTNRTFSASEVMIPLECNVHGWMHAYVGVLPHPYFATTGADGSFTIANLPAGTYTVEVWHETLGTQEATVTVADGESKTADFTLKR
jgi:carboxypeptidase family protein